MGKLQYGMDVLRGLSAAALKQGFSSVSLKQARLRAQDVAEARDALSTAKAAEGKAAMIATLTAIECAPAEDAASQHKVSTAFRELAKQTQARQAAERMFDFQKARLLKKV